MEKVIINDHWFQNITFEEFNKIVTIWNNGNHVFIGFERGNNNRGFDSMIFYHGNDDFQIIVIVQNRYSKPTYDPSKTFTKYDDCIKFKKDSQCNIKECKILRKNNPHVYKCILGEENNKTIHVYYLYITTRKFKGEDNERDQLLLKENIVICDDMTKIFSQSIARSLLFQPTKLSNDEV